MDGLVGQKRGWWRRFWPAKGEARQRRATAFEAYRQIVARARRPVLYQEWGVPDTHDGRFEAVGLEAMLLMRRLRQAGPAGVAMAQEIFNVMFADMDGSVREQGVGDLKVGKYIKRMAGSFLARARELDGPIDRGDRNDLAKHLTRYFHGTAAEAPSMKKLAEDLLQTDRLLQGVSDADLLRGIIDVSRAEPAGNQYP